ncbi:MAG: RagB/SusD family nutrient uptake outer membrane protein [Prevotella sp.]|nr:RagB/SusD family nutrient uptake outer membrane protein [Prevotella sp.]
MKANIKLLFSAGLIALTTSCTDLDVTPQAQFTEYPTGDKAVAAQMSEVYYHLRGTLGRRYMEAQALSSDEWVGISFDGDYEDGGIYAQCSLHNFNPSSASTGWYEDVTAGITKANRAMFNMGDNATPEMLAPARFMRAYYTWIIMDSFGDAPILDHLAADGEQIDRSPRADVARWIESELKDIIDLLPTNVDISTYGKPTRYVAEALLVKLYINWPVYTAANVTAYDASNYSNEHLNDVVALCDDIIKSGKFSLSEGASGYRSKFWPNNGYQIKDFIYAMPFDAITAQGFQYCRPRIWRQGRNNGVNGSDGKAGPGYFGSDIGQSSGGNFSISPEFADVLMALPTDDRQENILAGQIYMFDPTSYAKTTTPYTYKNEPIVLEKTIRLKNRKEGGADYFEWGTPASDYPSSPDIFNLNTGKDVKGWSQGYKSVKYFVIRTDYINGRNQSNDLPIFRYADILLTKAEAIARGASATNGETAQSLFNQIRSYVKAPTINGTPSLNDIYEERGRELFDENWRRNDMIRFGHFEDEYGFHRKGFPTARFDKECRIFPIPQDVLNKNTNWKQNPGY